MLASTSIDTGEKVKKVRTDYRKREYSHEHKLRVIRETQEPGASVSVVARRHDINSNVVFRWRKLYREGKLGKAGSPARQLPSPEFIPVQIVGETPAAGTARLPSRRGAMELALPGGIELRMDAGVDEAALRRVLRFVRDLR
jgi:transposase